jgi:hypothetical protein
LQGESRFILFNPVLGNLILILFELGIVWMGLIVSRKVTVFET